MLYIHQMNVNAIDLNLLRVFDTLRRTQSVTLAAEALNLTQPALSHALKRLRALFDDPLFVRTPGGMRPTPAAERAAGPIGQALAHIESVFVETVRFDPASTARTFRFSTSDLGETIFLPPLIAALRRDAPAIRIETLPVPTAKLAAALESGAIDLAMGSLTRAGRGVRAADLFGEPHFCVLRADHPRAAQRLTRARLADWEYVVVAPAETVHRNVELALRRLGLAQRIVVRMPHFMAIPGILEVTDLMAVVPERVARQFCRDSRLVMLPFPAPLADISIRVFWHARFEHDAANRWIRELVVRLHRQP